MGAWRGANARHEYGLEFMRLTGQRRCAYCDTDLTSTYQLWLTLVLDHVIPVKMCKSLGVPSDWCWDYSNAALACAACNGFCNRYAPTFAIVPPGTLEDFWDLRDKVFEERKQMIAARHKEEHDFFEQRPWNVPPQPRDP